MKKYFLFLFLTLAACSQNSERKHIIDNSQETEYLFVLSARSGTFNEQTLTLETVPLVIYFSASPYRKAGHITLKEFLGKWDQNTSNYKTDPPNATLSIVEDDKMIDAVVELMNPRIQNNELIFNVRVLENKIPTSFGPSSLFIDYKLDMKQ